ncbi:hypothetical protein, partial [Prochlorothrix hollandica]|uniref:hypothetical protein n=1 Tax=Prochlorothrix hollandica TaxID=1223 RepID=UPI0033427CD0
MGFVPQPNLRWLRWLRWLRRLCSVNQVLASLVLPLFPWFLALRPAPPPNLKILCACVSWR